MRRCESYISPVLSLVVVRNGRIIKSSGYGLADVELNALVTEDTVFEIGSITKQFTATAVMMLVEEGQIGLGRQDQQISFGRSCNMEHDHRPELIRTILPAFKTISACLTFQISIAMDCLIMKLLHCSLTIAIGVSARRDVGLQ